MPDDCKPDEISCDGECHPFSARCNRINECKDGADEADCIYSTYHFCFLFYFYVLAYCNVITLDCAPTYDNTIQVKMYDSHMLYTRRRLYNQSLHS